MRTRFFKGMSLERLLEIVVGMAKTHDLYPSKEVYERLYELEKAGVDVEGAIGVLFDGKLLRQYQTFKTPLLPGSGERQKANEQGPAKPLPETPTEQYEFAVGLYLGMSENLGVFQKIYLLHRQYLPVFTLMHEGGKVALANAYREWLFANYPGEQVTPETSSARWSEGLRGALPGASGGTHA